MKYFNEIFEEFKNAPTRKDKVAVLKKYDSPNIRLFFKFLFSKDYKFFVDIPEWKRSSDMMGMNYTTLFAEIPKLNRFLASSPIDKKKKSELLLNILEGLYHEEADILISLLNKDLKIDYMTPSVIKSAYGEIDKIL